MSRPVDGLIVAATHANGVFTASAMTGGTATKLAFTVQPTNTTVNSSITPAIKVAIQDDNGNTVTSSNANVTIALGNNPTGATLSGTTTVAAVNGVATFPSLSIDKAGTGYTLIATSAGLTSATSSSFNITAASSGIVLAYDSGAPTGGVYEVLPNSGWIIANRLTAPSKQVKILTLSYYITGDHAGGNGSFIPVVYASSTAVGGVPGVTAMYEGSSYAPTVGWNNLDVSGADLTLTNTSSVEFFVGVRYNGTTEPMIGYTETSNERAWEYDPTQFEWKAFDAMQPPFPATLFIRATVSTPSSVVELENRVPQDFELYQNYPNPFNPSTTIRFALPRETEVELKFYNVNGQEVATLVQEKLAAGTYTVQWNGKTNTGQPAASGVYFYGLRYENKLMSKKLLLLR
ncbi:MAG: FlgD immunoglobulin-like domain containing protein [Bacteroidota bacterium]